MAIRQVGGAPVYVIEVDVPKVTDARGRSYGTLVSDQRWKLWEEVQNSELQKMKFEQLTKQAQLDILEQKQRDISRAIRDAREIQAKVRSGAISPYQAQQMAFNKAKAEQSKVTVRTEPARDPFTGEILEGQTVETKTVTTPGRLNIGAVPQPAAEDVTLYNLDAQAEAEAIRANLDQYITDLEKQELEVGTQFQQFVEGGAQAPDLLSRTRGAFQSQIGEGGFGISRRPLRQLPRFDELAAVGLLDETIAREEGAIMDEARRMGFTITPQAEQDLKRRAREEVARQLNQAGATPTSRAGFLMKEPVPPPALLPRQETRVPTGRFRDDFAVETAPPALDRRQEILRDLDRVGLGSPEASGLLQELEDLRRVQRATTAPPSPTPAEKAIQREVELEVAAQDAAPNSFAAGLARMEADDAARNREEAIRVQEEERLMEGRMPTDRGFTLPIETIAGVPTTTGGRPGGLMDRLTARRLAGQQEAPPAPPVTPPMVIPTPITPSPVEPPVKPTETSAKPAALPPQETLAGGYLVIRNSDVTKGGTVYGPDGKAVYSTFGASPVSVEDFNKKVEELRKAKTGQEVDENLRIKDIKKSGASVTLPQRQELYAMKTIKKGLELADKPKQFARLSKSDNPSAAPEYIRTVNGVYEVNSSSPLRFKLTYDEIARVYRDDPATREKALSYLVAKDALETNVTKPIA